jgi:hypothetical protein
MRRTFAAFAALLILFGGACASAAGPPRRRAVTPQSSVDELERRTFQWFWDTADPQTALVPDRWPTQSFSSVAAVGFGLTPYGIGAVRGGVTRAEARDRVLKTLRYFRDAPQGPQPTGVTGYHGFFYHFLDMKTGARYKDVELSDIDTALMIAGALFCQSYFDRDDPAEAEIRSIAEELYRRVEWDFMLSKPPQVSMGWTPEKGYIDYYWHGYNEAMILFILGIGSPTHPLPPETWSEYTSTYKWVDFYGQQYVGFAPLFGYQYSMIWIDPRRLRDAYMRAHGIDYFENSRRATVAQRAYAVDNPGHWRDYGSTIWGLTACDGPGDRTVDGRTYHGYTARGATQNDIRDDGTIAPTAAASSIVYTPELSIAAIQDMQTRYGDRLYAQYGFKDAFTPQLGWFDPDYLGIDQGPIVAMIENYRSQLVWKVMAKNQHISDGLQRAGFTR